MIDEKAFDRAAAMLAKHEIEDMPTYRGIPITEFTKGEVVKVCDKAYRKLAREEALPTPEERVNAKIAEWKDEDAVMAKVTFWRTLAVGLGIAAAFWALAVGLNL